MKKNLICICLFISFLLIIFLSSSKMQLFDFTSFHKVDECKKSNCIFLKNELCTGCCNDVGSLLFKFCLNKNLFDSSNCVNVVQSGNGAIATVSAKKAKDFFDEHKSNVTSYGFIFSGNPICVLQIVSYFSAQILKTEKLYNITNYYAFSSRLKKYDAVVEEREINLQIAVIEQQNNENQIVVAVPIIMFDY